jgi:hypothetical protein
VGVVLGVMLISAALVLARIAGTPVGDETTTRTYRPAELAAQENLSARLLAAVPEGARSEPDAVLSARDISLYAGPDESDRVQQELEDDGLVAGLRRTFLAPDGTRTRIEVYQFASAAGATDAPRWSARRWMVIPGGTFESAPPDLPAAAVFSSRVRDAHGDLERDVLAPVSHYLVDVDVQGPDIDATRDRQLDVVRHQMAALASAR